MRECPSCLKTWGDEVRICHSVTDKTRKICGARLMQK